MYYINDCMAYINDLPEKLTALLRSFADDTAVYRVVYSGTDQVQIQQDLHCLMEWEESWDMLFHPAKCVSLPVTRSRSPLDYSYELHGHTLDSVSSAKYLGITIQQDWTGTTTSTMWQTRQTGLLVFCSAIRRLAPAP